MSESANGEERAGPGSGKHRVLTEEERLEAFRELMRLDEDPVWEWNHG